MSNKIQLFTIEHKRNDFIEMQFLSFKKNLKDDFEYIVFENASIVGDHESFEKIKKTCNHYNIKCISIEKDLDLVSEFDNNLDSITRKFNVFDINSRYTTASIANAYPLQWVQKYFINDNPHHVCGLHSDMFMIKSDSLLQYLKDNDFLYMAQGSSNAQYAWPAFFLMKNTCPDKNTLNWWCGSINNEPVDVGGYSYYFLQNKNIKAKQIQFKHIQDDDNLNFHPSDYELISFTEFSLLSFLHYRSGSNWNYRSQEYHLNKTKWLKEQIGL